MNRLCLYYIREPETDRWIYGDRFVRHLVRRWVRGPGRPGGLDKVYLNLRQGLDRLKTPYVVNLPFQQIQPSDHVAVLGLGRHCLDGYRKDNPIVAGIGLMTHPSEWPTLCTDYPVVRYLQHSAWCDAVYRPYFGDRCAIWPVGIDTQHWQPAPDEGKTTDFLLYDKIHWERESREVDLLGPIRRELDRRSLRYETLRYGHYEPGEYRAALARCRAMIFLSAHESQGIAAQEALSCGLPLLAWDPGKLQDPDRFSWGQPDIPTTSVPYFDGRCGLRFQKGADFPEKLPEFMDLHGAGHFSPRSYILDTLEMTDCARKFLDLVRSAGPSTRS